MFVQALLILGSLSSAQEVAIRLMKVKQAHMVITFCLKLKTLTLLDRIKSVVGRCTLE